MEFVAILLILSAVVAFVTAPLRGRGATGSESSAGTPLATEHEARVAELEAAREAKYREIRDAELDHRTGKLSAGDFEELDGTLRAEAVEILNALAREQAAMRR